ncbi:RpiR family transcriptional regulator [Mesorhizobium sp. WSM3879]|uniref:MurR/RpiR family transcriptional regulator n=1 Tax=unclassified Mesorhizobium TaxID=325217 RepID=UPI000BB068A5|nr:MULTISPECIES: MurR/RpiR family transcriptional regulator [unclassified Mesorhizobium]PBB35591.1 RpiR family transcriptional regulator [Mesorhizobium sp. WSM3868]PBB83016.1 RpiR family transcriptional regulator [Mesorhizobium sp. WSM3879]
MTEADSQALRISDADDGRHDHVRRFPDIISQVKDSYTDLRPAERRVADVVLDDVKYAVDASNAALAQRAQVSEPTVTRFCRAIGCDGVRDFKLKLAQSLVVGALYLSTKPQPTNGDSGMPFWNAVFGEARRALQEAERQIDPGQLQKAAELIAKARQVTVFGLGGSSSALAQETQYRLFRYGITISAQCDPYLMRMTASTLKPGDVVIAISATGRTREVIEAVELAKHYRADAICVTAPDTELTRVCDVQLTMAVPEYPDTLKPTASRYAFLAAIDLLAVASAYKLDGPARETVRRIKYNAQIHRTGKEMEPLGD